MGVGIILYYSISPQLLERHRLYNSDDVLNSRFRQLHTSRLLAQCANGDKFWKEIEHNVERRILYYGEGTKDSGAKNSKTLSLAGRLIETARGGLVLPTRDWKM